MKKRLIIGDTHGYFEPVKTIYDIVQPTDVIMLGDYVDSFEFTPDEIETNFNKLLELKLNHTCGEFIMLIGNHDFQYFMPYETCSGFNGFTSAWAQTVFEELYNKGKLLMVYVDNINKTIYSHAGVSNYWLKEVCKNAIYEKDEPDVNDINSFYKQFFVFNTIKGLSYTGNTVSNGPLWIRPQSLSIDPYCEWVGNDGYVWTQIVGHTHVKKPVWVDTNDAATNNKILLLDAMPTYYLIETIDDNGKIINREIKMLDESI